MEDAIIAKLWIRFFFLFVGMNLLLSCGEFFSSKFSCTRKIQNSVQVYLRNEQRKIIKDASQRILDRRSAAAHAWEASVSHLFKTASKSKRKRLPEKESRQWTILLGRFQNSGSERWIAGEIWARNIWFLRTVPPWRGACPYGGSSDGSVVRFDRRAWDERGGLDGTRSRTFVHYIRTRPTHKSTQQRGHGSTTLSSP